MDFWTMMATHFFGNKGTEVNPQGQITGATKGVWNDSDKSAGKQYIRSGSTSTGAYRPSEMSGMGFSGANQQIRKRLEEQRQRQYGLITNKKIRGLLS